MKLKPIVLSLALLLSATAQAGAINVSGSFDYAYQMYGSSRTLPIQVFDDGKYTYLEVSGSNHSKLIVQYSGNQEMTVAPGNQDGEGFIRLPGIFPSFHVRGQGLNAEISYMGVDKRSQAKLVQLPSEPATVSSVASMPVAPALPVTTATNVPARVTPAIYVTASVPATGNLAVSTQQAILDKPIKVAIPFLNGRFTLGPKGRAAVARVAALAKSDGHIRLVIGGDGGARGDVLAARRSKFVSENLTALGVLPTQVDVVTQSSGVRAGNNVFVSSAEVHLELPTSTASPMPGRMNANTYNDPRVASIMSLWRAKLIDDVQAKALLHTIGKREVESAAVTATPMRISYTLADISPSLSQDKPPFAEPSKLPPDVKGSVADQPNPRVESKLSAPVKEGPKLPALLQVEGQAKTTLAASNKPLAVPEKSAPVALAATSAVDTTAKPAEDKKGAVADQPNPRVESKLSAPVKEGPKLPALLQVEGQAKATLAASNKPLAVPEKNAPVALAATSAVDTTAKPAEEVSQVDRPTLVVKAGEPLAYILRDYLATNGMRLVWGVADAWKTAATSTTFSGATPLEAVGSLLRGSGLQGFYARAENTLFIR